MYESHDVTDNGRKRTGRAKSSPKHYNWQSVPERDVVAGENVIDLEL